MARLDVTLTALQQRILALVLAFVPLSLVAAILFSFASAQFAHHQRVSLLVRELNRYQALLKEAPHWQTRLATIKSSPLWQSLFLPEPPAQMKNQVTQNLLAQIVTKAGGSVLQSSTQANGPQQGKAAEVNERVVFDADIATLTHTLYDLRAPEPLLVIRHLSVRNHEGPLTAPRKAPNRLYIELTVTGFARPS